MHDRSLTGAMARGHWDGTAKILQNGRDWIVEQTKASGLRGRGVRLVVLGACETAKRDEQQAWSGVVAAPAEGLDLDRLAVPVVPTPTTTLTTSPSLPTSRASTPWGTSTKTVRWTGRTLGSSPRTCPPWTRPR